MSTEPLNGADWVDPDRKYKNDALMVPTAALGAALRKWVDKNESYKRSGMKQLEVISGFHVDSLRRIINTTAQSSKNTSFTKADLILTRIGLGYLLQDGTIPVIPNPSYTMESWAKKMRERGVDQPHELIDLGGGTHDRHVRRDEVERGEAG